MATITVTTNDDIVDMGDGVTSLREAIRMANTMSGSDVIVFDLGSGTSTIELELGDLDITDTLEIDGGGTITVDGANDTALFDIIDDASTTFRNITLEDGRNENESGGAINSESDLTLVNVTISSSSIGIDGEFGGAIFVDGDISLTDSTIEDSFTEGTGGSGGAIYSTGNVTLTDSVLAGNQTRGDDAPGGAVFAGGTLVAVRTEASENATLGDRAEGGAYYASGLLTITDGLLMENRTEGTSSPGGAVYAQGDATIDGVAAEENRTGGLVGGSGDFSPGGAIYIGDDLTLSNATVSRNQTGGATSGGGAVFAEGEITGSETVFSGNLTLGGDSPGGALAAADAMLTGTDFLDNSTAGNGSAGGGAHTSGALSFSAGMLMDNSTAGNAANGGALAGQTVTVANSDGAVSGNSTSGVGSSGGAISALGVLDISNATVSGNMTTGESALGGALYSGTDATVSSASISGNSTSGDSAAGGGLYATGATDIESATFATNATAGDNAAGGGIAAMGPVTLTSSTLSANATTGANAPGGGLHAAAAATVIGSTITGNSTDGLSSTGGGMNVEGLLTLLNATISANGTAGTGSEGGGIAAFGESILTNATIGANRTTGAVSPGGGLYAGGELTAVNLTVTGNVTNGQASQGGGIFSATGRSIGDSIVVGNLWTFDTAVGADIFDGSGATVTPLGVLLTGESGVTATDLFRDTFTLLQGTESGQIGDNGGQVATVALLEQSTNPALDAGTTALLAEAVVDVDLNGDGDLGDAIMTDARGIGFPRPFDIPGIGAAGTAFVDLGAYEAGSSNRAPTVVNDVISLTEGDDATSIDPLANDSDLDGDTLTVTGITVPDDLEGRASFDAPTGLVTFDPLNLFSTLSDGEIESQAITYTVSDGNGGISEGTITIEVEGTNAAPNAVDDAATTGARDPEISIDVLANDIDSDRLDSLTIMALDTSGTFGTARISDDGLAILYDPDGAFDNLSDGGASTDQLAYTIEDDSGATDTATLTIRVEGEGFMNGAPVAVDDALSAVAGAVIRLDPLADNGAGADSDPDGGTLTLASIEQPENGVLLTANDGTLLYRSRDAFTGTDSFDYILEDDAGLSDTGQVSISVAAPMAGTSLSLPAAQRVAYTYEAALDRDGEIDVDGLNFWIRARFEGIGGADPLTEDQLALAFLTSGEFIQEFGDPTTLADRELIEVFYRNVLDREGEEAGIQFWESTLANPNFERTDLLIAFARSPENLTGSPDITTLMEVEPGVWDFA